MSNYEQKEAGAIMAMKALLAAILAKSTENDSDQVASIAALVDSCSQKMQEGASATTGKTPDAFDINVYLQGSQETLDFIKKAAGYFAAGH
ncbi:TPA: hypothetical protein QDZ75_001207 [Stenotrophomonas maltophilia]|uniref:hypothetical protein n=1 Tax=Stenotrophomonas sp. GD04024 TaxID=2975422 RepID=UPI00244A7125|nr:hypothetical protein [Stenotrophomonas sp. GD04024]MDG9986865.1 hypothetical protein [Stenotrophomonas sp. GD04024]HDS1137198.1 hypothetical protein [Stenotrophomonas maltophilia]HEL5400929.1 hypothetical protein [Stenotrophomonas maltophilia]